MSTSVRPETPGERIKRTVAAMRQQGATDTDIETYLTEHEGLQGTPARKFDNALSDPRPPAKTERLRDVVDDFGTGVNQGMSFNFGDEIAAGTMALVNKMFHPTQPSHYDELKKEAQSRVHEANDRSPVLSVAGNLVGAMAGGSAAGAVPRAIGGGARESVAIPATIKEFLKRKGRDVAVGAGSGAVAGFGAGDGDVSDRLATAGQGAVFGGSMVAGSQMVGGAAKAAGLTGLVKNLAPRATESASTAGRVSEGLGLASHQKVAIEDLLADVRRSGLSIGEYLKRAKENPNAAFYDLGPSMNTKIGSPLAKVDPKGDPLVRRARGAQSVPSRGSAQISDVVNARSESRPGQIKDALEEGLGVGRENVVARESELVGARAGKSKPKYDEAYAAEPITDDAVIASLRIPEFKLAYQRGQRIAELEGVDLPDFGKTTLSVRTKQGKLRADLSKVSTEDLEAEYHRALQANAAEDAAHSAVEDQGYRHDYHELPRTERRGVKGREDLPDADGMVDPEKLLNDNKIVAGYNKGGIARDSRKVGIERIKAELARRPKDVPDTSFEFGANVKDDAFDYYGDAASAKPERRTVKSFGLPTQGFDYMKRGLDDLIESKMAGGAMGRTEARALRNRLKEAMDRIDEVNPAYREARGTFADASREIESAQLGNDFWKTRGDELEVKWPTLSPSAQQEYRKTALASIEERLGSGMNPAQLLNEVNARKLRMIAGSPEAYQEFEKKLRMSLQGGANDAMIMGGSPTARIAAEQADVAGDPSAIGAVMHAGTGNLRGLMDKVLQNGATRRLRGLSETRVDQMAPFLTAKGTDLTYRLELMQQIEKELADIMSRRGIRNARAAGAVGGSLAGKP